MHRDLWAVPLETWPGPLALALGFRDSQGGEVGQIKLEARSSWSTRRRFPGPELRHRETGVLWNPLKARFKPAPHYAGTLDLEIFQVSVSFWQWILSTPTNGSPEARASIPAPHLLRGQIGRRMSNT